MADHSEEEEEEEVEVSSSALCCGCKTVAGTFRIWDSVGWIPWGAAQPSIGSFIADFKETCHRI